MPSLRRWVLRLLNALRPGRAEPEIARELAAHLALLEDECIRRGLGRDEARLAARRAFGGVAQTMERHRDARSFAWIADAGQDLRHGARVLRRTPLFTLTAALSLAIGIGATATIAALANALFFRSPSGVADTRRVVDIGSSRGRGGFGPVSYPNYFDLRRQTTTLAATYASSRFPQAMSLAGAEAGARAETVFGTIVSTNYFSGLQPVFGPAGVTAESRTLLVVGVAHEVKATSVVDGLSRACVYVPLRQAYSPRITLAVRTTRGQRITDELRSLVASRNSNLSIVTAGTLDESLAFGLTPQRVVAVSGGLGAVGLLLAGLGICGVTAYVVTRRTREIGIRMAMGAPSAAVIRMILRQGIVPVAAGAAVGLTLAAASARVVAAYLFGISSMDPVTFLGVSALFLLIALAACYAPVRRATRIEAVDALRYE